jgi:hypothetical protein
MSSPIVIPVRVIEEILDGQIPVADGNMDLLTVITPHLWRAHHHQSTAGGAGNRDQYGNGSNEVIHDHPSYTELT